MYTYLYLHSDLYLGYLHASISVYSGNVNISEPCPVYEVENRIVVMPLLFVYVTLIRFLEVEPAGRLRENGASQIGIRAALTILRASRWVVEPRVEFPKP